MGAVIATIEKGRQKRKEILEAIILYIQEHGYAPTVREIGEMVGLKSASSVQSHLDRMLADGMIETDAGGRISTSYQSSWVRIPKEDTRNRYYGKLGFSGGRKC